MSPKCAEQLAEREEQLQQITIAITITELQ
jgi:hypothetical protein